MKKTILILTGFFLALVLFSTTMTVHTNSGSHSFELGEIESITFETGGEPPDNMIFVQGGTFSRQNGDGSYPNPEVMVTLSSFYIGQYEVTNQEVIDVFNWAYGQGYINCSTSTVTNAQGNSQELLDLDDDDCAIDWNGSSLVFGGSSYAPTSDCPCIEITWYGSVAFCNYKSLQEGLTVCYDLSDWSCNWSATGYRLPTEMEWMFAAKGGNDSQGYTYSGSNTLGDVAWYSSNSGGATHPVGTKDPNELFTYDMSGNVWEWCWDWYGSYPSGDQTNPTGPSSGSYRVIRGGGWFSVASSCTVSYRLNHYPDLSANSLGFRLLRVSP